MKFKNIEVSGIETIVFDRTLIWKKLSDIWVCVIDDFVEECSHEGMMTMINHMKDDGETRMWVHGYTLNIETG